MTMRNRGRPVLLRLDFKEVCLGQSQSLAEDVFGKLSPDLDPEVTLMVISEVPDGELEVETLPFDPATMDIHAKAVNSARATACLELQQFGSMNMARAPLEIQIQPEHFTAALATAQSPNRKLFSSGLAKVASGVYFALIVELDEAHSIRCGEFVSFVAQMFLETRVQDIESRSPRSAIQAHWSVDEMLRRAVSNMLRIQASEIIDRQAPFELYENIARVSALPYEGLAAKADITILPEHMQNEMLTVRFRDPIALDDHLTVRKHLELCDSSSALVSDGFWLLGLTNSTDPNALTLRVGARGSWTIIHRSRSCVQVVDGQPYPVRGQAEDADLAVGIQIMFKKESSQCHARLLELAKVTRSLPHGALVVVGTDAQEEANRLALQCTRLAPTVATPEFIKSVTRIDGATLVDPNGICHGLGAILDGTASKNCTRSRGARFNSALRYVESGSERLAFVKSEDGLFDMLPHLPGRFERTSIERELKELGHALALENPRRVVRELTRLRKRAIYLDKGQCEFINSVARKALEVFDKNLAQALTPWADLVAASAPNPPYVV